MLTLSLICLLAQVTVSLMLDFLMTFTIAFLSDNGNDKNNVKNFEQFLFEEIN